MNAPTKNGKSASEVFEAMTVAHAEHGLRISEMASPWWFKAPGILLACARISVFPLDVMIRVAEAIMAGAILGIAVVAYLWWSGAISDADIVAFLSPIGTRILDMVEAQVN